MDGTEPVCVECDKKNQKALPQTDTASSKGMPCENIYSQVSECMNLNIGQISACRKEWEEFKKCHNSQKQRWRNHKLEDVLIMSATFDGLYQLYSDSLIVVIVEPRIATPWVIAIELRLCTYVVLDRMDDWLDNNIA